MSVTINTPVFTASYPNLFEPRLNKLNNKNEYSVVALFKKGEDLATVKKAIEAAGIEKFGPDKKKWPKNLRTPLRDQIERAKENDDGESALPDGYEAGAFFLNLKTTQPPGVVDRALNKILDKSEIYAGAQLMANLTFYGYDQAGNKGVACTLNHIQKVSDGRPLGGSRGRVEDAFTKLEESGGEADANGFFG